jgi:phosphoribosylformylglycinamidine cyclo-ligase
MKKLSYKSAGVDIDKGERIVGKIKELAKKTMNSHVISGIGGFGACYLLEGYKNPVLVSGTDGVGTKLKVAFSAGRYDTVGIDLVAMCVNDILTLGAKPLFFLDYVAGGILDEKQVEELIKGIVKGCELAGCVLIGGETAEMPGFYKEGEYELVGFAVGAVEKEKLVNQKGEAGDVIVGIKSSGLHSNGYSLVRKLFFEVLKYKIDTYVPELESTVGEVLLTPTRIYVKPVLKLLEKFPVKAMAHITGGGIPGNIVRVLSDNAKAIIKKSSLPEIPVFEFIKNTKLVEESEMFRTFNMGMGFAIIVSEKLCDKVLKFLKELGEDAFIAGEIVKGNKEVEIC